jgi:phospholipid/cholesterol/gamma-HCH transport system substrate-binding protein
VESEAKYTLVGLFVVIATLLVVVAVMWLSKAGTGAEHEDYTVYFTRQSLEGLQVNSVVTMKGIKVGSVDSFSISAANIEQVKVLLVLSKDTPVKTNTRAIIKRNLLTGLAWIELVGGSQEAPRLVSIAEGEDYPVIPEGISELEAVAKSVPELIYEAGEVLKRIKETLSPENVQALSSSLKNVEDFTALLGRNDSDLRRTIKNVGDAAQELQSMSKSIGTAARNGDKQVEALAAQLLKNADELNRLIKTLNETVSDLGVSMKSSTQVVVQDVSNISQSLTQAARSFTATAEHLSDLKNVVGGPAEKNLGPGERVQE